MGFFGQLKALIRKDFRIFLANRKASTMEVLFPILMGVMTGLFILLVQLTQDSFGEYQNIDTIQPIDSAAISSQTWLAVVAKSASKYALGLALFLAPRASNLTLLDNFTEFSSMFTAYKLAMNETTLRSNYLALEVNSSNSFTLYSTFAPSDSRWSAAFDLADLMTSSKSQYPQRVARNTDYESLVNMPNLRAIFSCTGCIMLIYAFIPSLILTGGRLVEEKRVKARESLKVMGLSDTAYLVSNFISSSLRMAIGTGLMAFSLAAFKVIEVADIPVTFFVGLLFAESLIAFAQIMPSLFNVSIWSNVMCIILLAGGAAVSSLSTGWGKPTQLAVCLCSPVAFFYALLPYMANGTVHLLVDTTTAVVMLAIDTLLYILIGNYIYAVAPGEFGVPKHPLFFVRWIWHTEEKPMGATIPPVGTNRPQNDRANARILLNDLTKYFGSQRDSPAVNKLSLQVNRGEIFALLGHNGAGKTTTISILTGMITPTTYVEASVDGFDISESMDTIRSSVGLCPQFDVLFNDLTARQHLELFAEIKGNVDKSRIDYLMAQLELPDTAQKSSTFSGGTKRRLSVGNAFVGGATLIYLDEPSSGMDPLSRRKMWDLIRDERDQGKTIVLTTHFMEEADYLGERIAIMSRGRLYCCNTSQQLKETFGVGYYLIFVKNESSGMEANVASALALVRKFIPEATLHHESSGEAQFLLPITALPVFGDLLTEVELRLQSLGFYSYGLSMNTLEDVFVNISEREEAAHLAEAAKVATVKSPSAKATVDTTITHVKGKPVEEIFAGAMKVSSTSRFLNQVSTVFWRKVTMLRRTRRMQLMIILFPIFFIVTAFLVIQPQAVSNSLTEGLSTPDFQNLYMIYFRLRDYSDNDAVMSHFRTLYENQYPNSTLTVYQVDSMDDYGSGRYVQMESLNFAAGFKSPEVTFGYLPHHVDLAQSQANFTFVFSKKFAPTVGTQLLAMVNTAIELAQGNTNAVQLFFDLQAFPPVSSDATQPPTAPPQTAGSKETTYNFMQVGMYTVIAVVQLVANCAIPVSDELQRQVYHASRVQGMSAAAYFVGNLLFDFTCCLFPLALMVIMVFVKQIGAFYSMATFWVVLAGLMFAIHAVLQAYVLVIYVEGLKPVTYTGILHGLNLAMLGLPYLVEVVLNAIHFPNFAQIKPFILAITPPCAFYHILDNTSDMTYSTTTASYIMTLTGTVATAWGFIFMAVEYMLPLFLIYAFAVGKPITELLGLGGKKSSQTSRDSKDEHQPLLAGNSIQQLGAVGKHAEEEDVDVVAERLRVTQNPNENMMSALHLRKVFPAGQKVAVENVTFGIRKGECFGLLGPNGAGKSTTCNMILRHIAPTSGDIRFPYANVNSDTSNDETFANARIGVCMQGDSLWDFLSAEEHMDQFLRLRLTTEYRPEEWTDYIQRTIDRVYLADAGERLAGGYSGGMKRKLLVCLAMYTGAQAVFLDEPSTGMDPFSRRALWSVILEALSHDRCVLLTTHSMEEADAVCSRISIITAGTLKCVGSSQHLKNRFGSGYVLTVVHDAKETDVEALDKELFKAFPEAEAQEVLGCQRRYGLGKIASLATAFKQVQAMRERLHLHQYSISQTVSLEQIFLSFVGTSKEGEEQHH